MDTPHPLDHRRSYLGLYAGFASRTAAFVIDVLLVSAIILFSTWVVKSSMDMLQVKPFLLRLAARSPLIQTVVNFVFGPVFSGLVSLVFIIVYYLFFWMAAGQTPGKYLIGIKIVAMDGSKLKLRHVVLRYAGYYLSGLALGSGFLWILVDDQRRAWHDRIANTCVIYAWDAHPDETFLVRASQELNARREALKALITRQRSKP